MRKRLRQSEQKKLNRDSSSNHSDPSPIQNMESQSEVPKENIVNSCWLIIQKASYSRISFSSRAQPSSSPSTSSSSAHTESEGVNTSATLSCSTSFLTPDSQDKRTTFRTETSEKNTLIIDGRRSARSWTSPLSSTGPCLPTVCIRYRVCPKRSSSGKPNVFRRCYPASHTHCGTRVQLSG